MLSKEEANLNESLKEQDGILACFGEVNFAELRAILLNQIQHGVVLDSPEDMWLANQDWQNRVGKSYFAAIYHLILFENGEC